jgi:biopolymer transport protein ExbD
MKLRRSRMEAEIPTASMADIAFLLICFFMVTAVFAMNRGIDFALPPDAEDQGTEKEEAIHIRITNTGLICVDNQAMQPHQIRGYLRPKLERWPKKPIILQAEPKSAYERFVVVYDELRQADRPKEQGGLGLPVKMNISIPSLQEIENLKRIFGEDIFGAEGSACG